MNDFKMENPPPKATYLQNRVDATNDPSLYDGLSDFNPLGLGFTNLAPEQKKKFEAAGLDASSFESRGLMGNLFPKWALSDALKQKRTENLNQINPAIGARNQQFADQQYGLDVQQREKTQDAQVAFDFGSKMVDKQLQGTKELAQQQGALAERLADKQGKLNLRQTIFQSATNRAGSRMWD